MIPKGHMVVIATAFAIKGTIPPRDPAIRPETPESYYIAIAPTLNRLEKRKVESSLPSTRDFDLSQHSDKVNNNSGAPAWAVACIGLEMLTQGRHLRKKLPLTATYDQIIVPHS